MHLCVGLVGNAKSHKHSNERPDNASFVTVATSGISNKEPTFIVTRIVEATRDTPFHPEQKDANYERWSNSLWGLSTVVKE